jgi:hypothetical protein
MTSKLQRVFLLLGVAAGTCLPALGAVTVKTVPFNPSNPSTPHTAIIGVQLILGATVSLGGSTDTFTYSWNFGDGSAPTTPATVTNPYDISATHIYSTGTAGVTRWTAVVTVTDTHTSMTYTGSYLLALEPNTLQWTVNIAIDNGLWYLHQSMWRGTDTILGTGTAWGGWDGNNGSPGCPTPPSGIYACGLGAAGLDAMNVYAFLNNGHLETGPSTDPYTEDVQRGIQRLFYFMLANPVQSRTVSYNPAYAATRCSDGSLPTGYLTTSQSCPAGTTLINENPTASSCASGSCSFTFDGNHNGQFITLYNDSYSYPGYENGMLIDALVATQNPGGTALTGYTAAGNPVSGTLGVRGQTYYNIVQDIVDEIGYCENSGDPENSSGSDNGGAWQYYCANSPFPYGGYEYNDNSPSQWSAIGLIIANRGSGFGTSIAPIIRDTNQVWLTWSQDWAGCCSGTWDSGTAKGAWGYNAIDSFPWGPFADTPSGLVQLTLDNVGRTAAGAADQRWNMAETFYRDNFCNSTVTYGNNGYYVPMSYTYGLYSFSKAMRLHSPGGVLTPITDLAEQPSGANPIDWYNAQASAGAPCNGVAQTLVSRQGTGGYWYNEDYDCGPQCYFETAWSILILEPTVLACVGDLAGAGTAGGRAPARIDLSWTPLTGAVSYNVLRSTTTGGPYSTIGNTTSPAYADTSGLVNGDTYYYVVDPLNSAGSTVCQSSQVTVTVP